MRQTLALCLALLATAGAAINAQDRTGANSPATTTTTTRAPASETGGARARLPPPPTPGAPPETTGDATNDSPKPGGRAAPPAPAPDASPQTTLDDKRARPAPPRAADAEAPRDLTADAPPLPNKFHWSAAVEQSLLFLGVQHGYALTQPKTRRDLRGPFLKDYFASVKSLHGWGDGGRFFTNYVAHPLQGSLLGFVQIQNDPAGARRRFGKSGGYWRSRMKALAWSAAWSTQFEIGPVSQASIGNVGLHQKQTYVDLVITPVGGLGLILVEDAVDRYVIERIERATRSYFLKIASRVVLNPTRSVANLLRFKTPWHRDAGLR